MSPPYCIASATCSTMTSSASANSAILCAMLKRFSIFAPAISGAVMYCFSVMSRKFFASRASGRSFGRGAFLGLLRVHWGTGTNRPCASLHPALTGPESGGLLRFAALGVLGQRPAATPTPTRNSHKGIAFLMRNPPPLNSPEGHELIPGREAGRLVLHAETARCEPADEPAHLLIGVYLSFVQVARSVLR